MSEIILFIVEGNKTEHSLANSLFPFYFTDKKPKIVTFGAEIYQLYSFLKKQEYADYDIVGLLKERGTVELDNIKRSKISEIYLFFDYDGHARGASDEKIKELITYFDDETGNGKLFVSYPMIESIKHIIPERCFSTVLAEAKVKERYKEVVSKEGCKTLQNLNELSGESIKSIHTEHLKKANFLCNDKFELPEEILEQQVIFDSQLMKYIKPDEKISVLNGFPMLFLHYFGVSKAINKLS
ncbi:hypothetical protein [uncultured Pseudoalteromonas sp.]|uniref:hypothetical protein n=1 Tax=uncultured Pseudoalteromonas sp. TaxID=114053 RepID=UPI0025950301|nr:hypothetical protein [uncultured Pseudoalteromonas sp.]